MTRKDYELIAKTIHATRFGHDHDEDATRGIDAVAEALTTQLKRDNPNFDRERFLRACGVGD